MHVPPPETGPLPTPPPCGYHYRWRSLPERTGGAGTWPVTVSTTWTVNWTTNIGLSGSIIAPAGRSTFDVEVGEYRTALVGG